MKVSADLKVIADAVAKVKVAAASRNGQAPALRTVQFVAIGGWLHVRATDFELFAEAVPAGVTVHDEGRCALDVRELVAALKGAKRGETLELVADDAGELVTLTRAGTGVASARSRTVRGISADDWPKWRPAELDGWGRLAEMATAALSWVIAAAARDDLRPALCGVCFDGTHAVATDSYRLHACALERPADGTTVVPRPLLAAALKAAKHLERLELEACRAIVWGGSMGTWVRVHADGVTFTAPARDVDFPNWRQLCANYDVGRRELAPAAPQRITVGAAALVAAAKAMPADDVTPMRLIAAGGRLDCTAIRDGSSTTVRVDDVTFAGGIDDGPLVAFNPGFLADFAGAAAAAGVGAVTLAGVDHLKPWVIVPAGAPAELFGLLMPVRTG